MRERDVVVTLKVRTSVPIRSIRKASNLVLTITDDKTGDTQKVAPTEVEAG